MGFEKDMRKQMDMQRNYDEMSDQSMGFDDQQGQRLPSNIDPEDYYRYKKFVNLPESQSEFSTKIDKDVVFGNFSGPKPNIDELRFQIGTIELFESEFVIEQWIPQKDANGNLVRNKEGKIVFFVEKIFDEDFRGCLNFLKAEYKFACVASRGLGDRDRAAMLDISNASRISKEFNQKKESSNKLFNTGLN